MISFNLDICLQIKPNPTASDPFPLFSKPIDLVHHKSLVVGGVEYPQCETCAPYFPPLRSSFLSFNKMSNDECQKVYI